MDLINILLPDIHKLSLAAGAAFCLMLSSCPDVSAQSGQSAGDFSGYVLAIPGSDETIEMTPVEGSSFLMGNPGDGEPRRKVRVDSFWMSTYEITWDQYDLFANEVMGELRSELEREGEGSGSDRDLEITADAISTPTPPYVDMSFGMGKEGFPAINVTHYAASMFTKWLSAKTGTFYRLPTEAEWEYACRAGTGRSDSDELDRYAWHKGNSDGSYHKVGMKAPNAFGLHDMLGNVAEWTIDQYHEDYFSKIGEGAENPWFKPTELYPRTVRGGSWQDGPQAQSCTNRRGSRSRWKMQDPQIPKSRWWLTNAPFVGIRIVRPENPPSKEQMEQYWIEAIEDY